MKNELSLQNHRRRKGNSDRGFVSIISAVVLLAMVPMLGLSVDASSAYVIRTALSSALDSAALAAARNLNVGSSVSDAQSGAVAAATLFFNSNFPVGYLGTDPNVRTLTPLFTPQTDTSGNPNGILQISIQGTVNAPSYFGRLVNVTNIPITAVGSATRKSLVMTLVLDQSSSMGSRSSTVGTMPSTLDTTTASSCEAMVYEANNFLTNFTPYDTVGVITFDYTAHNVYPPSTNFKKTDGTGASTQIANISCGNNTNTTAALELAYRQIKTVNQPLAQNAIVLFTDGVPNGVTANFPIRRSVDTRLGPSGSTPSSGACTADTSGTVLCTNMPVACSSTGSNATITTVYGTITQTAGFSVNSGGRGGLYPAFDSDTSATFPAGCPTSGITMVNQTLAYIPPTDAFGNLTSGLKWDTWLYQTNNHCAPSGTPITPGNTACKNLGAPWTGANASLGTNTAIPAGGTPSNFFPTGSAYAGQLRPDLVNAIGVASMTSAVYEAWKILDDTTYHPTIHTIYLQGNGGDPVDKEFLQIVSNQPLISCITYEQCDPNQSGYVAPYANTNYKTTRNTGKWLQTPTTTQLKTAFASLASSLLRISQ